MSQTEDTTDKVAGRRDINDLLYAPRRSGDLLFAVGIPIIALFLLSQIGNQTQWVPRIDLILQPAFWPAVSLAGIVIFGVFNLTEALDGKRQRGTTIEEWREALTWLRSLEFVAWFMAYVTLVPLLGYLPASLLFWLTLSLRAGYRRSSELGGAMLVGAVTVFVFKTLLGVRIPGGALYEWLPATLRNFMIINF